MTFIARDAEPLLTQYVFLRCRKDLPSRGWAKVLTDDASLCSHPAGGIEMKSDSMRKNREKANA